MSETPKRQWFRFHLLTAVVASAAIALAMFLNMVAWGQSENKSSRVSTLVIYHGWPYWSWSEKHLTGLEYSPSKEQSRLSDEQVRQLEENWKKTFPKYEVIVQEGNLISNIVIGLTFVIAFTFAAEWLIRRREARKI